MYLDVNGEVKPDATTNGYLAVAIPGTVLGLETALQKYGTMSRQQVMAPAIRLAKQGYVVTPFAEKQFKKFASDFRRQPNVASIFLDHGHSYPVGARIIQSDLARTLSLISEQGANAFYKGEIAREIVEQSKLHGGILALADFANYNVEELPPVQCQYHGYTILSAPPPSSGGVAVCEMLNILENFPLKKMGYQSASSTRAIVESMRYGFLDRNQYMGDPDFADIPIKKLLAKPYANEIAKHIKGIRRAPDSTRISVFKELSDTTHYSVVDAMGNAVSVTYTLNGLFGARVIAGNTGFFLNDEMDDFSAKPGVANKFGLIQGKSNQIAANKRPLSSMSPTMVFKGKSLYLVLGSPGGPRIISSVLLTLLNVLDFGMTIQQAVNAPRFHYQGLPDVISMEPMSLPFLTRMRLIHGGYHLLPESYWSAVEAIEVDQVTGLKTGANDSRRPDGLALGGS